MRAEYTPYVLSYIAKIVSRHFKNMEVKTESKFWKITIYLPWRECDRIFLQLVREV